MINPALFDAIRIFADDRKHWYRLNFPLGTATVQFFDGPHDPLTFLGPIKVLDAKMSIMQGDMPGGLGLGKVMDQWEE